MTTTIAFRKSSSLLLHHHRGYSSCNIINRMIGSSSSSSSSSSWGQQVSSLLTSRTATAVNGRIMNNNKGCGISSISGRRSQPQHPILLQRCGFSDNITYSGGHASSGQGGFYGSGGARATNDDDGSSTTTSTSNTEQARSQMLAMAVDVQKIEQVVSDLAEMESRLEQLRVGGVVESESKRSSSSSGTTDTTATPNNSAKAVLEIRNAIKKLMTAPEVTLALNRLVVHGEPVWGLSVSEREMIKYARDKVNEC